MKKILALVLAAVMLLSLAATAAADEKTVLTMWCIATESDANRPAYEQAIAEFEAAHPDVEIKWEAFENQSYKKRSGTALLIDNLYEIKKYSVNKRIFQ